MAIYKATNNAISLLASALSTSTTMMSVLSGHGARFPVIGANEYTRVTIQDTANRKEIVDVTARTDGSDTMTIVRGREGTIPLEWEVGALVELRPTAAVVATLDGLQAVQNKTIDGTKNSLFNVGVKELLQTVIGVNDFIGTLPGLGPYVNGQRIWFVVPEPNTGPCTLSVNGGLSLPIVKDRGRPLQAGDLKLNELVGLFCDGSKFWLTYGSNGLTSAVEAALGLKAPLDSPVFTGTAKVPVASDPASPVRLDQLNEYLADYAFEVGDYKLTSRASFPARRRWLMCDSRTIGSPASGATALASLEARELFVHLWETYPDAVCPVFTSGGVSVARGSSAAGDWANNRRLQLIDWSGLHMRVHHNGSPTYETEILRTLGSLQMDEVKAHSHSYTAVLYNNNPLTASTQQPVYSGNQNLTTGMTGGPENRIRNRSLNLFIRY